MKVPEWFDFIWPTPSEVSGQAEKLKQRLEEEVANIPTDESELQKFLQSLKSFLAEEKERRSGVDSRLTSLLGLSTIAGTIVFSFLVSLAGPARGRPTWSKYLLIFGALYLVLQICSTMLAAVRGLSRRAYRRVTPLDVVPAANKLRGYQEAKTYLEVLSDHSALNNQKVTWMAVAHCAMRNFLAGLLIFAVVAAIAAMTAQQDVPMLDYLKQNSEVRELLRGPQGAKGDTGQKGEPGSPGPAGKCK